MNRRSSCVTSPAASPHGSRSECRTPAGSIVAASSPGGWPSIPIAMSGKSCRNALRHPDSSRAGHPDSFVRSRRDSQQIAEMIERRTVTLVGHGSRDPYLHWRSDVRARDLGAPDRLVTLPGARCRPLDVAGVSRPSSIPLISRECAAARVLADTVQIAASNTVQFKNQFARESPSCCARVGSPL